MARPTRRSELELIKLTARYLESTKPQSCKNYRVLAQEPLFRGMCFGLKEQLGITPDEIEKEVCETVLSITTSPPIAEAPAQPAGSPGQLPTVKYDRLLSYMHKFRPEEVEKLPPDLRPKAWQLWIAQQLGKSRGREVEFDDVMHKSMEWANELVIRDAQQAAASGDDA
jgi:hypothetical protein